MWIAVYMLSNRGPCISVHVCIVNKLTVAGRLTLHCCMLYFICISAHIKVATSIILTSLSTTSVKTCGCYSL